MATTYYARVLDAINRLHEISGPVSGDDVCLDLPDIPRGTVFALIQRLKVQGKIEPDLFKAPRGAAGREVTVYRPAKTEKPTLAQELELVAWQLKSLMKRVEDLAKSA